MAFPDGFVEEVRRAADIVRLISDHVALKKMGASWKGLCPFHQEKTASFNVRSEPPVFHCFGCGEGGDVFKFVMLRERVSFPDAIEAVARRFGVAVPERRGWDGGPGPDRKEREELLALLEAAAEHYQNTLWSPAGSSAREYLLGRSFRKETLERIRAGAARDSWEELLQAMKGRFAPGLLAQAGLVVERQGGGGHYDRFRNRAVFPILNESGKVVAFGARSLDGSEPKYLNSPETAVYQKGRTLYGLSWARDAIHGAGRVVLMEGYLDVARALEAGVAEAVATCGTALTTGHARLLRRFAERVAVNFDQDAAGQKAARKALDVLVEEGLRCQVVELPPGDDPDSYLKAQGPAAYRERLDEAPEHVEWLIRRALAEHDTRTPAGKGDYLRALLPALARLESAVERAAWAQRIAARGGLDETATEQELRRALAGRPAGPVVAAPKAPPARPALLPAEKWLLTLLVQGHAGSDAALAELLDDDLEGLASAELLRAAKALYLKDQPVTAASLEAGLADDAARRLLTALAVEATPVGNVPPVTCVFELRRLRLERRLAAIQKQLAGVTEEAQVALSEEKLRLARQIAVLSGEIARAPAAGQPALHEDMRQ
jgi:DNA primase